MRPALPALLVFLYALSFGADLSPDLFNGLKWRLIGPFRGGRAVAVNGVAGGGSTFYFGAVGGGVWKSEDAGAVWTPLFDAQHVASIGALEVAPSDPNVLYAGTGESDIRSDLASGDGVYRSNDGGQTWTNVGLRDTRQISRILVNPRDANVVFVAALGHAYAPNDERGVFRSKDGGATWERVLDRGPKVGAADIAIASDAPDVLIASMWEAHRPPWSTYAPVGGPGSGLFRSTDAGHTWQQLTGHGLPNGEWGRVAVAIARGTHGRRMYALIDLKQAGGGFDVKQAGGLYRSDNGGDSWALVNKDPRLTTRAWYFSSITVDPNDPDVLYAPNVAAYKLSDGGKTLSILRGAPGGDDYHQIWIDPANSLHMVLGTDQGTSVTLDGGKTWSTWYNQPTAQLYHVVADNAFPYHLYGAQQDSGTVAIASQTDHGEIDARDWFSVGGSESGYIAPDPRDPNIFYVSGVFGSVERCDRRMLQSQNIAPWPRPAFGTEIPQRKYRDPWTPVLVFSPLPSHALYLGTQYLMKTLDGGLHWQAISPDLTGAQKDWPGEPSDPLTIDNAEPRAYGVVYTIAPSPLSAAEIWAGSDTGMIHLTRDGGKTWSDVTPKGLAPWSKITQIEASRFSAGTAYAAIDRHRLDDMRPYLYRTRDFGNTWEPIITGIAPNAFLNAIREDPKRRGLLFAGTEFGVYASFDDGERWMPLQLNLPVTSVRDLVIHDDDLIVATHGRSFWILDDIVPLRQLDARAASAGAWLYRPKPAMRITNDKFSGTPLPPDEPQAENPARGAYVDYYLRDPASKVELDVRDARGKIVRRYASHDKPPDSPKDLPIAPRWLHQPQALSKQAGMHRFVWDLQTPPSNSTQPQIFDEEGNLRPIGALVMPGRYTLLLRVDGREFTQPLQVTMDPRSHATAAELAQQFQWAARASADLARAREAEEQIAHLQAQLATSPHRDQAQANQALAEILTGPADHPAQGLRYAAAGLSAAFSAIESADRTPPAQAIALYQDSAKLLNARLRDWAAIQSKGEAIRPAKR
jgi:photosystem II stability/assembly factor-like uncharacterized protein